MAWRYLLSPALAALILLAVTNPRPAHAYIDPGSGSYMLQLFIGAVVGSALAIRLYWEKIVAFFARRSSDGSHEPKP